jgi:hypothetical protein
MLAGVDQEARIGGVQHVRIVVQRLYYTIQRRLFSGQPVRIDDGGAIEQGRHFEIADLQSEESRHLVMMRRCGSQSGGQNANQAGQCRQNSGGESHRISLEHVSTPKVS